MHRQSRAWSLLVAWACLVGTDRVQGQGSTNEASLRTRPCGGTGILSTQDLDDVPVSGRVGPSGPRVSSGISTPSSQPGATADQSRSGTPVSRPTADPSSAGPYEPPSQPDDDGPPHGLTLDQAIGRLLNESLDLRGKAYEIPQAQADVLTAGLRANPVFYADGQLVPYGDYSRQRPGGQQQYDVNASYPLDLSHKRQARMVYATRVKRVIEAQYQDAVRVAIDQLYGAFVDVLAARQTVRIQSKA